MTKHEIPWDCGEEIAHLKANYATTLNRDLIDELARVRSKATGNHVEQCKRSKWSIKSRAQKMNLNKISDSASKLTVESYPVGISYPRQGVMVHRMRG